MLKKLKFFILSAFLIFFALECLLRVVLAIKIGPDILFYGILPRNREVTEKSQDNTANPRRNIHLHDYKTSNYTKYYSNQKRFDSDKKGNIFSVRINRMGFRGKDFEIAKPYGVLRVVCLGGSSTLGYGNKDNETYPYYLEEILNKEITGLNDEKITSAEVINLGIPHLRSDQIFSLFAREAIRLSPDIVTFYEGVNDTTRVPLDPAKLETKLLIIELCRRWQEERNRLNKNRVYYIKDFQKYSEPRAKFFISNISRIEKECRAHNIKFYFTTEIP